jgi:hypothetical protein
MKPVATARPAVRRTPVPAPRSPARSSKEYELEEELRVRLDDVQLPGYSLDVDGLRPTLGSFLYGLYARLRPAR